MKKIFVLAVTALISTISFAQRSISSKPVAINHVDPFGLYTRGGTTEKTSKTGDTVRLANIADTAGLVLYPTGGAGNGYATGENIWGDHAFAEQYTFNGADSALTVIGVYAQFGGAVHAGSSNTININLWAQGQQQLVGANLYYNGFPTTVVDSMTVPVTKLGIGAVTDTLKKFMFPTPSNKFSGPFFAGYSINYDFFAVNGDTIALATSRNGVRKGPGTSLYVSIYAGDTEVNTVLNVQNATLEADGNWHDNYTDNDSLYNNLAIYPIAVIAGPTGVGSVVRNNFTFSGNYPNPATTATNISISLARNCGVTVQVMDMTDRIIKTITESNLPAGAHTIPINTADMPAGDYLYLIRTTDGEGVASKMTVIR